MNALDRENNLSLCICTERPDIKSEFNSVLYQLLLDPSERVCFEAIQCILGKHDNTDRYMCIFLKFIGFLSTLLITCCPLSFDNSS